MSLMTFGWMMLGWLVFSTVMGSVVGRCIACADARDQREMQEHDSRGR